MTMAKILYSPEFGLGWPTWTDNALRKFLREAEDQFGKNICVYHMDQFCVDEYDGSELLKKSLDITDE